MPALIVAARGTKGSVGTDVVAMGRAPAAGSIQPLPAPAMVRPIRCLFFSHCRDNRNAAVRTAGIADARRAESLNQEKEDRIHVTRIIQYFEMKKSLSFNAPVSEMHSRTDFSKLPQHRLKTCRTGGPV